MNIPLPPSGPGDGWINLTKLADRIEKHVLMYRRLTYVNVIVFGINAAILLFLFVAQWWMRH